MTRKEALSIFVSFLMICASFPSIILPVQASDPQQLWALIICGSEEPGSFPEDVGYMYHVLNDTYDFDGIYYLHVYTDRPGVDANATKNNVRSAINTILASWSDNNDIIFIYFSSHGGGYHITDGLAAGRVETVAGDEGNEQRESTFNHSCWKLDWLYDFAKNGTPYDRLRNIDDDPYIEVDWNDDRQPPYSILALSDLDGDGFKDDIFLDPDKDDCCNIAIDVDVDHDEKIDNLISDGEETTKWDGFILGVDFNGNGNFNDWVGIDECLQVQDGLYWDDELASDLDTLSYAKLIFVRQGCVEGGEGCFGGGLIDDISAANRIIMTATDETHHSHGPPTDAYSCWSEHFIDALHGEKTHWDNGVAHEVPPVYVDADLSNDGHVSMWEAFRYAWLNDEARLAELETPWIDDNGNKRPTYRDEHDAVDDRGGLGSRDGLLAWETYFGFDKLKSPDMNGDHKVNIRDISAVARCFGAYPGHPRWNASADLLIDYKINIRDIGIAARMFNKNYSSSSSSSSTNTPVVSLCPDETTVCKHEPFSVNVTVTNVTDLYGFQFRLYYNATVLNCTGVSLPSDHFLKPVNTNNIFIVRLEYDNEFNTTHGFVWVAVTLLGEEPSKNGSGILAMINFTATSAGSSILNLHETMLADTFSQEIPTIVFDGSATVLSCLTVLAQDQYSNPLSTGDVYIDDQLVGYTGSTFKVDVGTHEVFVNDFWEANETGYRYGFKNWTDGSVDNPRNVTVVEDRTITAFFIKKWCPGDANGDGIVNIRDVSLVGRCFGSYRGHPNWDSRADLDCNKKINIRDISIVSRNFGNEYPDP